MRENKDKIISLRMEEFVDPVEKLIAIRKIIEAKIPTFEN